jgi:Uroporphyrinogen-III decarboxylase
LNKRELVKNAIQHIATGYTPYSIYLTGEGYKDYGNKILEDYNNSQVMSDYKNGKIDFNQAVSLAMGNHVLYINAPWWGWHNLPKEFSQEDTPSVMPTTIGYGNYESFFERCDYIRKNYDVYMLVTVWGSHWEKAYFCRGIENFLYDLAYDPEWSQNVLDLIIRKNIVMLENILHTDSFDGVLLGSDWGTQRGLIMSPDCWRTMIKHGEKAEYDLIHSFGKDVWVHSCGKIDAIMSELCEIGMDVLNPVQPECMDLKELKENYGHLITYYGGISTQRTLPYGTPDEVAAETEYTINLLSNNGGYITAPSQEIQTDVPYENLRALIDTAKKYGL